MLGYVTAGGDGALCLILARLLDAQDLQAQFLIELAAAKARATGAARSSAVRVTFSGRATASTYPTALNLANLAPTP